MTTDLFAEIAATSGKIRGWCTNQKATALAASIVALRPEYSLEIGVWGGKSFLPMAMAHRAIGKGKAIGVDPWSAPDSASGEVKANADWWGNLNHESMCQEFIRLVGEFDLGLWVDIQRLRSDDFNPPAGIGVLSVDGNHAAQAIRDVHRYAPKVVPGGFIFMDDTRWEGGNVLTAIKFLPSLGFRQIYHVQNHDQGGTDDWCVWQKH